MWHGAGAKHLSLTVTRSKFEQMTDALLTRTRQPCKDCLRDAGVTQKDITEVLLVGGMTRMPKARTPPVGPPAPKPSQSSPGCQAADFPCACPEIILAARRLPHIICGCRAFITASWHPREWGVGWGDSSLRSIYHVDRRISAKHLALRLHAPGIMAAKQAAGCRGAIGLRAARAVTSAAVPVRAVQRVATAAGRAGAGGGGGEGAVRDRAQQGG